MTSEHRVFASVRCSRLLPSPPQPRDQVHLSRKRNIPDLGCSDLPTSSPEDGLVQEFVSRAAGWTPLTCARFVPGHGDAITCSTCFVTCLWRPETLQARRCLGKSRNGISRSRIAPELEVIKSRCGIGAKVRDIGKPCSVVARV